MPMCPKCYSRNTTKFGKYKGKQRWYCQNCKHTTSRPRQRAPKKFKGPRSIRDWYQDIYDFHKGAGHHIEPKPAIPPINVKLLRISLIKEEVNETLEGIDYNNLQKIADGITDSIVVLLGTAVSYGIDIRPIWDMVHEGNMRKIGGPIREDGKSLKPEGWKHPDIGEELRRQQDGR